MDDNNRRTRYNEDRRDTAQGDKGSNWAVWLLVAGGVLLLIFFLFGTPGIFGPNNGQVDELAERPQEQVFDQPEQFMGSRVDLTGEVDRVLDDRAFVVDGPGIFGDQLLVVSRTPLTQAGNFDDLDALEENEVTVTGVVREFNMAQLQQELGVEFDTEEFRNWEGRPIVVAEAVNVNR
jgi:hypothetical protein